MHQELIRELAMITDEERRILEGKQEIDPQLYTEKKEMVVDSAKLLKLVKFGFHFTGEEAAILIIGMIDEDLMNFF